MHRRWFTRWLVAALLLAALVAGGWYLTRPEPVPVRLVAVSRGDVAATVANTRVGTVKACRRAYLAPTTAGQVARLPVHKGDVVEAGSILLEIWNDDLQANLALARAETGSARAKRDEACALAAGAERDARRLERLLEQRLVAPETVDNARTEADAKRAGCAAAEAAVNVARARVAVAEAALERSRVRAPFDGVVADVNPELGEYVTPSPPGIATLPAIDFMDVSCLYVLAPIDEVDAPKVRVGQPACVSLDAFEGKRCGARVRSVAPYVRDVEKQARTVDVEVDFADPGDAIGLAPGYSADIEITLAVHHGVLRIPTEAVLEGNRVLVYDADSGRLVERRFEPGLSNWEYTEVVQGLDAGQQVVLSIDREGVTAGALARPEAATGGNMTAGT